MFALSRLSQQLKNQCPAIHATRLSALLQAVTSVLTGRRLSIAGLGRALKSSAKVRHNIKKMNRLVGNSALHQERVAIYQALARGLLGTQPRPVLIVDWSDAKSDRALQLLRASVVVAGRSMTVYEEAHPLSAFDKRAVRQQFLLRLQHCLPHACCPIVVSDAGFRVSWYQQIEALGWDWVGRVRGRALYRTSEHVQWQDIRTLYPSARTTPRALGAVELTQNNPHRCYFYRVRLRQVGRLKKTMYGRAAQSTQSKMCAARHTEPWLLATSLKISANKIVALYRQRTQIEGSFRDLKCAQWGFHLRAHRTRSPARLQILVLIGTLAAYVAWLTGLAGYALSLHRQHQANTVRSHRVLSFVYLGLQLLWHDEEQLSHACINQAYDTLRAMATSPVQIA